MAIAMLSTCCSVNAFAAAINLQPIPAPKPEILSTSYEFWQEDVVGGINSWLAQLKDNWTPAAGAARFQSVEVLPDAAYMGSGLQYGNVLSDQAMVRVYPNQAGFEANQAAVTIANVIANGGDFVTIPYNTGGHWTALSLVKDNTGAWKALYTDSIGSAPTADVNTLVGYIRGMNVNVNAAANGAYQAVINVGGGGYDAYDVAANPNPTPVDVVGVIANAIVLSGSANQVQTPLTNICTAVEWFANPANVGADNGGFRGQIAAAGAAAPYQDAIVAAGNNAVFSIAETLAAMANVAAYQAQDINDVAILAVVNEGLKTAANIPAMEAVLNQANANSLPRSMGAIAPGGGAAAAAADVTERLNALVTYANALPANNVTQDVIRKIQALNTAAVAGNAIVPANVVDLRQSAITATDCVLIETAVAACTAVGAAGNAAAAFGDINDAVGLDAAGNAAAANAAAANAAIEARAIQTAMNSAVARITAEMVNLHTAALISSTVRLQTSGIACGAYTVSESLTHFLLSGKTLNQDVLNAALLSNPMLVGGDEDARQFVNLIQSKLGIATAVNDTVQTGTATDTGENIARVADVSARQTANAISRRLGEFAFAAAAGEDVDAKYGAWVSFSGGNSQYKFGSLGSNINKIKGTNSTITVGGDIKLCDTYTIGAAISFGRNDLKTTYKPAITNALGILAAAIGGTGVNTPTSEKDKISSVIGSVYGSMPIIENLILKGSFSGGQIKVKAPADSLNNRKGNIYNGDVSVTYYYDIHQGLIVAPTLGGSATFTKLGAGRNADKTLTSSKIDVKRYGVNVGLAFSKAFDMESFTFKPEAFVRADYYPTTKAKKLYVTSSRTNSDSPNTKILTDEKSSYSAGASLSVVNLGMVDISVGYVRDWQKRYKANTGFAKLRINF